MRLKQYLKQSLFGFGILTLYYLDHVNKLGTPSEQKWLILTIFCAVLFPFAKGGVEAVWYKITKQKVSLPHSRHNRVLFVIYYSFCFVMAIPFGLLYLLASFISKMRAKHAPKPTAKKARR